MPDTYSTIDDSELVALRVLHLGLVQYYDCESKR